MLRSHTKPLFERERERAEGEIRKEPEMQETGTEWHTPQSIRIPSGFRNETEADELDNQGKEVGVLAASLSRSLRKGNRRDSAESNSRE